MYDSPFGDMSPLIIANALNVDLVIVESQGNIWDPKIITGCNSDENKRINVYKKGEHYDGLDLNHWPLEHNG